MLPMWSRTVRLRKGAPKSLTYGILFLFRLQGSMIASTPSCLLFGQAQRNAGSHDSLLVVLSPFRTRGCVVALAVLFAVRPVMVVLVVVVAVVIVRTAFLVHEAVPRTVTVLRVRHCSDGSVFPSARFTSFQNVSSFGLFWVSPLSLRAFSIDRTRSQSLHVVG